MQRIRNMNDVAVGLLLIAVALAALYLSWNLTHGTAGRMGPGYVPRLFATTQIALAAALIIQGVSGEEDIFERWFPRPLFWVLVAVAFFGATIEILGLVVATAGLVVLSTFAYRGTPLNHVAVLALSAAAFCVFIFVKGLGLSILVWPAFLVR